MYKISCVKYINSLPFVYGLKNTSILRKISLELDTPADCYKKLLNKEVDIGLVPVVAIPGLNEKHLISAYGIGASGKVKSVILATETPLEEIKTVYLDYQSRTSVQLVRVLAKNFWKINPVFLQSEPGFVTKAIPKGTAYVVIGDRAFSFYNTDYKIYDLAEEWKAFTGKNFVFATWIANRNIDIDFKIEFDKALQDGLAMREKIIMDLISSTKIEQNLLEEYYYKNINFNFDAEAKEGMDLFLNLLNQL
ncbi:MAG: menaquinone biosynthesis protein [Bacteroidales bacterium]|nr:menaquinone biosynthesis protein [Bacteroidales bacterium]MCF8390176.1 menaquinone biosynthesis protein [Bacteroidales bacterium]